METTGIARGEQHHIGSVQRVKHPGGWLCAVRAEEDEPFGGQLRSVADPPLLKMDGSVAVG